MLHGRSADLVNIAGSAVLSPISIINSTRFPGVVDGVFFLRGEDAAGATGVTRLAAAVVAPTWECGGPD
jgi:hypothetical protein